MDERPASEATLREGETRHAFRLDLEDALRPLVDPVEIQRTATRILGEHLGANRVAYFDIRGTDYVVERDYTDGAMPLSGRYPLRDFGTHVLDSYLLGRTLVVEDVMRESWMSPADRASHAALQIGAFIGVPLLRDGEFVCGLTVHSRRPRRWSPEEIALVEHAAGRTWTAVVQAHAEAALARSEAKYRTLFTNIDEAFCVGELLYDRQGRPHDRRLLEANPRYHELVGDRFAIGTTAREVAPDIDNAWFERYHEVITTGLPQRFEEHFGRERWFDVYLSRVGGPGSHVYAAVFHDITERRRRESSLAFLAEVSRDLVALTRMNETVQVLGAKIGKHLGASICAFVDMDEASDQAVVNHEWRAAGMPSVAGTHALSAFVNESARALLRTGQPLVTSDVGADAGVNGEAFATLGLAAFVAMPIVVRDSWRATLVLGDRQPRQWRSDEIDLMRDVTARLWTRLEQARADEALRASDERHRALFSQMVGGVAEIDLAGRFISVNRRYCEMVGYDLAELLQMRIRDVCHPDDFPAHEAQVAKLLQGGEPFESENRQVRKDSSVLWVHHSVSAVRDAAGLPREIITVSVDITERKHKEEQVRRGAQLLDALIDRSPSGFFIVDGDLRITHMNAASQARAFRNVNPAIGRRIDEALRVLWPEDMAADMVARFRHTLATGESYVSPGIVVLRADLNVRESYDWQLQRIMMPDGQHSVVCYYYDTTRLRQVEQELREADRLKDQFLATLAHELRNPLAPMRNGLHLLKRLGAEASRFPEVHQMMERQLSHLVRLVDDLMEVSRITRGKVELRRERVDVASILHAALETSRPLIDAGRHHLELKLCTEPLLLHADPVRLTQVFTNLVNNAARYTEPGGHIWLAARRDGDFAEVSVRDTGLGIPTAMLTKIFDLFIQADPTRGRAQGGLGIGLTLVRAMVELHQGTIEARSEGLGCGSEFIVRLPLDTAAPATPGG